MICKGCGAALVKSDCIYCGTDSDCLFLTREEWTRKKKEALMSRSYLPSFNPISISEPITFMGKKVVIKE